MPVTPSANRDRSAGKQTNLTVTAPEGSSGGDFDPLDFLLGVMRDPEAAPRSSE
jgi:hypothetical protein